MQAAQGWCSSIWSAQEVIRKGCNLRLLDFTKVWLGLTFQRSRDWPIALHRACSTAALSVQHLQVDLSGSWRR
jgi:hypothetical protein